MKKVFLSASLIILVFLISCKKDSNNAANTTDPLKGNWKFLGMTAQTKSTVSSTEAGTLMSTVTTADYTSTDNKGIYSFVNGTVTAVGVGYSATLNIFETDYEAGILVDTFSIPYDITIPPINSTSQYKVIGTDSIYFPAGGIVSGSIPGSNTPQQVASGGKFTIVGDTLLTMTEFLIRDTLEDTGAGIMANVHEEAHSTAKLRRQ